MYAKQDCRRLVLATTNPHKLRELRLLLAPLGIPLPGFAEFGGTVAEAAEDGATLRDNARRKAAHYARSLGEWVLSDDTGLEVEGLAGAPGVRSSRYAGDGATMADNRAKLLSELAGVAESQRAARFVCWMAVADPAGRVVLESQGECAGRIRDAAAGAGGFGYDALFEVAGCGRTLAELDDAETVLVGHRGAAARHVIDAWREAASR